MTQKASICSPTVQTRSASPRQRKVVVVEDNDADLDLLLECFDRADVQYLIARNGADALSLIRTDGPDLVLLDLKMPGLSGHEVLRTIRSDSELLHTPIVVLSHSDARRDVRAAYDLGANCYFTKPGSFRELKAMVVQIQEFWLGIAREPMSVEVSVNRPALS